MTGGSDFEAFDDRGGGTLSSRPPSKQPHTQRLRGFFSLIPQVLLQKNARRLRNPPAKEKASASAVGRAVGTGWGVVRSAEGMVLSG